MEPKPSPCQATAPWHRRRRDRAILQSGGWPVRPRSDDGATGGTCFAIFGCMPRAIWSGHITFGLVSVPVGLYAAVETSEEVHFRLLHRKDLAPIRYKKFCSKEDVEVPGSEIVRGFEVSKGRYSVVEGEELKKVKEGVGEGDRTIELLEFVEFSSLNPLLFERPYYLAPEKGGEKPYALLREALLETRRAGIARFYLRTKPLLAALLPGPDLLALDVMRESGELRSPKGL